MFTCISIHTHTTSVIKRHIWLLLSSCHKSNLFITLCFFYPWRITKLGSSLLEIEIGLMGDKRHYQVLATGEKMKNGYII